MARYRHTRSYVCMRWRAQMAYVKMVAEQARTVMERDEVIRMEMVVAEMDALLAELEDPPPTPSHAGHHDPYRSDIP